MKFRDINYGQTIMSVDENGDFVKQDAASLPGQDDEVDRYGITKVATCGDEDEERWAAVGYDANGECRAAHIIPKELMLVICEVAL